MSKMIDWSGGRRPVKPDVQVEVVFRNGKGRTGSAGTMNVLWNHDGSALDIVQYRVVSKTPQDIQSARLPSNVS